MALMTVPKKSPAGGDIFTLLSNPFRFRMFLLRHLPSAYFSGLRLEKVDEMGAVVTLPFRWFTKNPFHSVYFACLSMAAEMSTGILAMAYSYKRSPKISMLVTAIEAKFLKKAKGKIKFACNDGAIVKQAIEKAVTLHLPQQIRMESAGYNENHELVAQFFITWSFKAK
ncbi:MAG: hypothetical protein NVS1B13_12610 [Flavisolibacter sp.]